MSLSSSPLLPSSSTGPFPDPPTEDSTEYPQIFLLAIFLPSLFVGLLIAYLHYSMRKYNELRLPFSHRPPPPSDDGPHINLVSALREELEASQSRPPSSNEKPHDPLNDSLLF